MSTSYLLNLENQFFKIQHESLINKTVYTITLNKWRPLNETKTLLVSTIIEKGQELL